MNQVEFIAKEIGAEPVALVPAPERQRRQGAVDALMVIGWDSAARDLLYADGYGCDDDLEILVTGLGIAKDRPSRTPAEKDRFATAIREVRAIMGGAQIARRPLGDDIAGRGALPGHDPG